MSKHISFLLFLMINTFLILFVLESFQHAFYYKKANDLSEFAVKTAENKGGFTTDVISTVEYRKSTENLDSPQWNVDYKTTGQRNFGESIEVNTSGTFTYRTFNLLGTGLGNMDVQINAPNVGFSNVWFRN